MTERDVGLLLHTRSGMIRGTRVGGFVEAYRGIPYAEDPVGHLRFAPPQRRSPWADVLDATRPGPAVPQPPGRLDLLMGTPPNDTDEFGSLTVNVWTPGNGGRRPVLVWLHGGAWVSGSGGWPWYDGARLAAAEDIVVVTANHRLGVLGYTAVGDEAGAGRHRNVGYQDEHSVLAWVIEHIEAFGGDPAAITLGGQSAGAESAAMIAASDGAGAHVKRLLLQSGGCNGLAMPEATANSVAADLLDVVGLDEGSAGRLRELDVGSVLAAQLEIAMRRSPGVVLPFGVVEDDDVPHGGTVEFLARRPDLDVMLGWTKDELLGFAKLDPRSDALDDTTAVQMLRQQFGDRAPDVYANYVASRPDASANERVAAIGGFQSLGRPALRLAASRRGVDGRTYVYRFDWSGSDVGACHCVDLPFAFGNLDAWEGARMLGEASRESLRPLADELMAAIGGFVRDGQPSPVRTWPEFGSDGKVVVLGDGPSRAVAGLGRAEMSVLEG